MRELVGRGDIVERAPERGDELVGTERIERGGVPPAALNDVTGPGFPWR